MLRIGSRAQVMHGNAKMTGGGLKKKDLFEGRDLNSTIDARAVYNSAMSVCFNKDPEFLKREVFWDDDLPDLTQELFKV